ncbi:MAG: hypothetical protein SH856_00740 [Flavobacteriales bacterium]|nr:hypothetical protein [Flavobacteriales bacterium]
MRSFLVVLLFAVVLASCKKEEQVVFTGNTIAPYSEIPTILTENYANRLYIDLIGREPTDEEMVADVAILEAADLSNSSRIQVINKLMYSQDAVPGDTVSYNISYFSKLYEDTKARLLEGTSEADLQDEYYLLYYVAQLDSMNGNMTGYELLMIEANKMKDVLDSREELRLEQIDIREMYRRMFFNNVYDQINMNTFNFINATFDGNYYRFPTEAELEQCFPPIEYNGSGILFGDVISSKVEYLEVLLGNAEYSEGLIRWCYLSMLNREPTDTEIFNLLDEVNQGYDVQAVQQFILTTDEYAGF